MNEETAIAEPPVNDGAMSLDDIAEAVTSYERGSTNEEPEQQKPEPESTDKPGPESTDKPDAGETPEGTETQETVPESVESDFADLYHPEEGEDAAPEPKADDVDWNREYTVGKNVYTARQLAERAEYVDSLIQEMDEYAVKLESLMDIDPVDLPPQPSEADINSHNPDVSYPAMKQVALRQQALDRHAQRIAAIERANEENRARLQKVQDQHFLDRMSQANERLGKAEPFLAKKEAKEKMDLAMVEKLKSLDMPESEQKDFLKLAFTSPDIYRIMMHAMVRMNNLESARATKTTLKEAPKGNAQNVNRQRQGRFDVEAFTKSKGGYLDMDDVAEAVMQAGGV